MGYTAVGDKGFGSDWCLKLQPLSEVLLTSLSNGSVHLLDWADVTQTVRQFKVADLSVSALTILNEDRTGSMFAAASGNKVKVYDVRQDKEVATLEHEGGANVLSLGSRHGTLAYGTELQGVDAELHMYDLRNWSSPVRSFVDSHHDDITDIKFHPSDVNLLMSGSTDGYTNIYDLTEAEEDDALHQVINYASIHSCGWLAPRRIYTLSHMETFAVHELNDKSEDLKEPRPIDFGDVRQLWGCDYVVDVYPGYVATGRSQEGTGELKIIPFKNEKPKLKHAVTIPHAHGDEVIRDTLMANNTLYSCGEDGYVRVWRADDAKPLPTTFWDYTPMNVLDEEPPKEKKKHSKKKHSKKSRFKPY